MDLVLLFHCLPEASNGITFDKFSVFPCILIKLEELNYNCMLLDAGKRSVTVKIHQERSDSVAFYN